MSNKKRQLKTDEDFTRYMIFKKPITIYATNELISSNVIIEEHKIDSVISTENERYLKATCLFFG